MTAAGPETCAAPVAAMPAEGTFSLPGALLLLSKPGIVMAETAAGFVGILLACAGVMPAPVTVCRALLVLILAASGAAMANCVLDATADLQMPRLTARGRALAAVGRVQTLTIALLLMGGAFLLTTLYLGSLTLLLLAGACGGYLLLYTIWLKRCSPWGVLAGAVPGALPPLIGAAAVTGRVTALPLLLGVVIFIWQLPHFWFLALHYRDQYRLAGIPVLPLTHSVKLTTGLTLLSAAALLPATLAFSLLGTFSPGFTLATLLAGILFLLSCYRYLYRTAEYRKGFTVSLAYLTAIFLTLITDIFLTIKH